MRGTILSLPSFFCLALCLGLAAGGCTNSPSSSGPSAPVQACLDVLSALASAQDRCGTPYDQESLDKTCIPSLRTISCGDLAAGNLDPSCQLQLERTK
jgi:hypothetical protein